MGGGEEYFCSTKNSTLKVVGNIVTTYSHFPDIAGVILRNIKHKMQAENTALDNNHIMNHTTTL